MEFFVMLTCQNGKITPMMDSDNLAVYSSFMEACDDANHNPYGRHFGYEVFERGSGHQG